MKLRPVVIALAFLCCPSFAQAGVLNVQKVTSASGINAWLVEDHNVPVLSMSFTFLGAGAVNDPNDLQGLSQVLSNTMDEGAGDMDSKAFQGALEDNAITLRFDSGRDNFGGDLRTLTKYRQEAFRLLGLALTKPRFDADAVGRMKEANLSRIRGSLTDPEWMSARLTNSIIFNKHAYARNSGGTLSSLPRVTPDLLREKQQKQLARDNLVVSVTGDITAGELSQTLDMVFGQLPATADIAKIDAAPFPDVPETALFRRDIPQTVISMTLPAIKTSDPDYAALEVMNFVLGSSGFGSRLTDVIREQRGLTYGIYSSVSHLEHADLLTISTATKNESVMDVIDLTQTVMAELAIAPISDKELKDAKAYLIGSIPLRMTSTAGITTVMDGLQTAHLPADYLDRREAAIRKVTKADVLRVAKRLLIPDGMQITLVGNPKMGNTVPRIISNLPDVE